MIERRTKKDLTGNEDSGEYIFAGEQMAMMTQGSRPFFGWWWTCLQVRPRTLER
jgi:hypothetical protein